MPGISPLLSLGICTANIECHMGTTPHPGLTSPGQTFSARNGVARGSPGRLNAAAFAARLRAPAGLSYIVRFAPSEVTPDSNGDCDQDRRADDVGGHAEAVHNGCPVGAHGVTRAGKRCGPGNAADGG